MAAARRPLDHFLVRHLAAHAVGDVLADRAGEQEGFLLDDADLPAQVARGVVLAGSTPSSRICPPLCLVEARQQVDQAGLARAGGPEQRH